MEAETIKAVKLDQRVPEGYKPTEFGIIPNDWNIKTLEKIATTYSGGTPLTARSDFYGGSIPWITSTDLNKSSINNVEVKITNKGLEKSSAKMVKNGDLLLALYGATAGAVAIANIKAAINQAILAISTKNTDSHYLLHYLNFYKNRIIAIYRQGGQPNLTGEIVRKLKIALPPKKEQTAIANALSDVDNLIESLDKLIAKKKAIKQATMQQLLTGKKRLPGFRGEWETKRVADMGEVVTGGTPSTSNNTLWGARYPWITPTDISHNRDLYTSERHLSEKGLAAIKPLPPETVLITCIASIGKNAVLKKKGGCNQQINAIIPNSSYSANFIYYVMEHNKQYILANSGTTATNIISKVTFTKLKFSFPNFKEQKAIATILSDIDSEIEALEKRKSKTQQIKEGMMQELLTGKTRLVNKATETYE